MWRALPQKLAPPQGPTGLPIIGCLPQFIATKSPELVLDRWAKKHGPIYSFCLGNQRFVILSDPNVVKDLLVSQSAVFSSRKDFHIKSRTILAGRGITATPYDAKWRAHRAIAKKWLDKGPVKSRTDELVLECNKLLQQLSVIAEPVRLIDRYVANNILRISFGADEESLGSAKYNEVLEMIWEFVDSTDPTSNAVDFLPFLQYLPSPSTARAQRLHERIVGIIGGILDDMGERLQAGESLPDCLAKSLLENRDKEHHDRLDIIMLCAAFIVPGFASVTSVVRAFAMTISCHPEVQERAHDELDRTVGRDRLPTAMDEGELPFIRAIIKEVERLHNPLWLGTPHFSTQDFEYRGCLIPKDSVVVVNSVGNTTSCKVSKLTSSPLVHDAP
ncbi:hypothetical protein Ac2012v2_006772 [Leucoagaricus gongylophorus]